MQFDFEIELLTDRLLKQIRSGELPVKQRLDKCVTIHDNCHSSELGEAFYRSQREIIQELGGEVVEMEYSRERAHCCGLSAAAGKYTNVVPTAIKRLREIGKTDADLMATYCNGCLVTLSIGKVAYPVRKPMYHTFELIQQATGEEPAHRHADRGRLLMKLILKLALPGIPGMVTGRRTWVDGDHLVSL